MSIKKRYEILDGLPAYGPMYISISEDGEFFSYEGFVIRFHKNDGTNWIANFKSGSTAYTGVFELPGTDKILIVAHGIGYIMTPEEQKPLNIFGFSIQDVLLTNDGRFVCIDNSDIEIVNSDGSVWRTERISWDGVKDVTLQDNIVTGLCYDPMDNNWIAFTFNLDTKEISGGSYPGHKFPETKKPFWKFW